MKILVIGMFVGSLGFLPVYVYSTTVQPQLEALKATYMGVDETASKIANGEDYKETSVYRSVNRLADN